MDRSKTSPFAYAKKVVDKPFTEVIGDMMRAFPNITNDDAQSALRDATILAGNLSTDGMCSDCKNDIHGNCFGTCVCDCEVVS